MNKIELLDKVYLEEFLLLYNCTEDEVCKYTNKRFNVEPEIPEGSQGFHFVICGEGVCRIHIIWMKRFDWTIYSQSGLNHELLHCATNVLDYREIEVSCRNDEALCYYHEFLFREFWNKLKPKKKRIRK